MIETRRKESREIPWQRRTWHGLWAWGCFRVAYRSHAGKRRAGLPMARSQRFCEDRNRAWEIAENNKRRRQRGAGWRPQEELEPERGGIFLHDSPGSEHKGLLLLGETFRCRLTASLVGQGHRWGFSALLGLGSDGAKCDFLGREQGGLSRWVGGALELGPWHQEAETGQCWTSKLALGPLQKIVPLGEWGKPTQNNSNGIPCRSLAAGAKPWAASVGGKKTHTMEKTSGGAPYGMIRTMRNPSQGPSGLFEVDDGLIRFNWIRIFKLTRTPKFK